MAQLIETMNVEHLSGTDYIRSLSVKFKWVNYQKQKGSDPYSC